MLRRIISLILSFGLFFQQISFAQVVSVELNIAGHLAALHNAFTPDKFRPLHLRYFSYDSLNDNFKVLLDKGDVKKLENSKAQEVTKTLLSYFLVGVTLPDSMFWVNLRPDSEDQIIDQCLEKTDVGKIMLEADLQLKKDTALFTSPQTTEGREYWNKLYKKAAELYGYDNVTIPTLTRPWIVPGEIIVRESKDSAYVYKATLKVRLEQDYLNNSVTYNFKDERSKSLNEYSSQLIRELIIPKLTKEVNSSKRYAPLRQVYYSLILSRWFKLRFTGKTGTYASLINTNNLTNLVSQESWSKNTYFKQYQKSFADGEYNIKEPVYTPTGQVIRSYFSGGINIASSAINTQNGIILLNDNVSKLGDVIGGKAVVDLQGICLYPAIVASPVINFETVSSPVDAITKQVLAQQNQTFEIPVVDLMKSYGSNIKWVIDRLKQSTAGTRGSIVIPGSDLEDEGDIHGGPELNAAVVLLMAQAYSNYISKISVKGVQPGAFVGFDPRYFSKEFAQLISRVMLGNGLTVYRDTDLDTYTATPLTSYMAYLYKLASGIEITSSHNPPNQNGIKSSTYYGGVDTDDISAKIAMEMEALYNNGHGHGFIKVSTYDASKIKFVDAKKEYFEGYLSRVFTPDLIASMKQAMDNGAKFIFDGLFGVGGQTIEYYLDRLFKDYEWRGNIIIMNSKIDPMIGGIAKPDPSKPETLEFSGVLEMLANNPEVLVSATADMDADRTGTAVIIPDRDVAKAKKYGLFVSEMNFKGERVNVVRFTPQQIFTLIGYDRAKQAIAKGIPVDKLYLLTSIPTSLIGKEMIASLGGKAILTTVGFKNLGFEAQRLDSIEPGALPILLEEESGGAIISPFSRDKRGSTIHRDKDTCVLALSLYSMASRLYLDKKNMLDLYIEMSDKLGGLFYSERLDAYVPDMATAESKEEKDKEIADRIKAEVISKFRAIDDVEGNLDKDENIAILCRIFGKDPADIEDVSRYELKEVSLLVGEGNAWDHIKPEAKRFTFKDGESIEVFHTGRTDQEGPSISIFDKNGKLKARALIRPSGTESLVRVYLEILEPMDNPDPQHLYDYFQELLKYLGLDKYHSKKEWPSYLEQHFMNIKKYETIDPFNLTQKDVDQWNIAQQQTALNIMCEKIFALFEKNKLSEYLSQNEKKEIKFLINKLREISAGYFEKSRKDNPTHHSFIVLDIVLRIALGEKLPYSAIKKFAALSILHDLGYGALKEGEGRVTSSEIKKMIAAYEAEKEKLTVTERQLKEREIKTAIENSMKARQEHMAEGVPVAIESLDKLNEQLPEKDRFSQAEIKEISDMVGMHDNPGIAKTYETEEFKPYIKGSAQELLIDKNNQLALIFREADRLWMLSYEGVIKDLMDKITKSLESKKGMPSQDDLSVQKQFNDNLNVFVNERKSYDAVGRDYGVFLGDTFIRTETGFAIFNEYRENWQELITEKKTSSSIDNRRIEVLLEQLQGRRLSTHIGSPDWMMGEEGRPRTKFVSGREVEEDYISRQQAAKELARIGDEKVVDRIRKYLSTVPKELIGEERWFYAGRHMKQDYEIIWYLDRRSVQYNLALGKDKYTIGIEWYDDVPDYTFLKERIGELELMIIKQINLRLGNGVSKRVNADVDSEKTGLSDKDPGKINTSSPMQSIPVETGGIDFRALPMTIQSMGSFNGLNFKLPQLSQVELRQINVDSEIKQIKNMVQSGIIPSGERIKELIAACMQKKEINSQVDNLLLCLADIFKLEEENVSESSPELREALVIVDSQS